jgi:hypothetical protein
MQTMWWKGVGFNDGDDELIFFGYSLIFCFCGFVLNGVFRQ